MHQNTFSQYLNKKYHYILQANIFILLKSRNKVLYYLIFLLKINAYQILYLQYCILNIWMLVSYSYWRLSLTKESELFFICSVVWLLFYFYLLLFAYLLHIFEDFMGILKKLAFCKIMVLMHYHYSFFMIMSWYCFCYFHYNFSLVLLL